MDATRPDRAAIFYSTTCTSRAGHRYGVSTLRNNSARGAGGSKRAVGHAELFASITRPYVLAPPTHENRLFGGVAGPRNWTLELAGNIAERSAEIGADQLERGDGGYGDKCRDQSIFDGRDPGIVPAQVPKWRVGYHRFSFNLSGGTRRFLHKSYSKIIVYPSFGWRAIKPSWTVSARCGASYRQPLWGGPIVGRRIAVGLRVHHSPPGSALALSAAVRFPVHSCRPPGQAGAGEPRHFSPSRRRSCFLDPHCVA